MSILGPPLPCTQSQCVAPDVTDLVATTWKGKPLAPGEMLDHATCRNGKKMSPDWWQDNVGLICNANLQWEVSNASSYSCVATSYCPAVSDDDGPAPNQDSNIPWGGISTLTRPGVEFTGDCLGVGLGGPDQYDSPKSCPNNVGVRVGTHMKTNEGLDCWGACGNQQGPCSWCGARGMCCKVGVTGNGCDGIMGTTGYHGCVGGKWDL